VNAQRDVLLEDLIKDAKLIAAYGQRAGLLRNADLLVAIRQVEELEDKSWARAEVICLQERLNGAIREIAPVTLVDLKSDWKPFSDSRKRGAYKLVFASLTFLMMIVTAFGTFTYNHGRVILTELERLQTERPPEKVGKIIHQVLASESAIKRLSQGGTGIVGAGGAQGTSQAVDMNIVAEANFQLLNQWRDIDNRLDLYSGLAGRYIAENSPSGLVASFLKKSQRDQPASMAFLEYICSETGQKPGFETMMIPPFFELNLGSSSLGLHLIKTQLHGTALACSQNVRYLPASIPDLELFILEIGKILNVYELWILPALFGALGSAIYFLRTVLNPLLRDPSPTLIVYRIALGAFAGIILAWFWTPAAGLGSGGSVGLSLFGAAFLVGFSIDVFFALLDKLVTLSVGAIARLGASADSPRG
jgi:hypothetical protein